MFKKIKRTITNKLGKKSKEKIFQMIVAAGLLILLVLGAFGQMGWLPNTNVETGKRTGWFGTEIVKTSESSNWNPFAETKSPQAAPQLSKEYIYAGSRLLAIEEAGGGATPTPTPTATPTPTPTPTGSPTPTPTPIPQIWEGTNAYLQVNADNSLTLTNGGGYRSMNSTITLNAQGDWVQQVYTADTTQGASSDVYGQYFQINLDNEKWTVEAYWGLSSSINGVNTKHGITHTNGDVMRFQRGSNGDILYYKNGVLEYTFTGANGSDATQPINVKFMTYYGNWTNGAVFPALTFGSIPQIWEGTNAYLQVNADNTLTIIDGGGYRSMNSTITLESAGDWVEHVYTADTTQGAASDVYGQYLQINQGSNKWTVEAYWGLSSSINGTNTKHGVTHTNGDVMKFLRGNNGDILYYKNGVLEHTFTGANGSDATQPINVKFMTYYGNWTNGAVFPALTFGSAN